MDTLNTFQDLLVFSNNTKITRQHKDRFYQDYYETVRPQLATRKIDRVSEVSGLTKYKGTSTTIQDSQSALSTNSRWFLVYATAIEAADAGVACYIMRDTSLNLAGASSSYPWTYFDTGTAGDVYLIKENRTLTLTRTDDTTVTVHTTNTQSWYITVQSNTLGYITVTGKGNDTSGYNVKSIAFSGTTHLTLYNAPNTGLTALGTTKFIDIAKNGSGNLTVNASGDYMVQGMDSVYRTNATIIKIIECPYCPLILLPKQSDPNTYIIPEGCKITNVPFARRLGPGNCLEIDPEVFGTGTPGHVDTNFLNQLQNYTYSNFSCIIPLAADRQWTRKDPQYESKLYHSDFYNEVFSYDTFTKDFPLENIAPTSRIQPSMTIYYKQSNTITSNLGFKFNFNNCNYTSTDTYEQFLLGNRNNELPIFTSAYLNYIKNGYNYDVSSKDRQNAMNWLSTGLQIGGAIISFALSGVTGGTSTALGLSLVTTATSSIANTIASNIQAEANIEQKLAAAKNTATSVSGSNDLDMINWYSGNKLLKTTYNISEQQKSNIFDLFYKTGYSCNEIGIPNVHSRYRFNFLQCTPDFTTKSNPEWQEYLKDVIARFELGVTYFHTYSDFEQQYENWESWLM